MNFLSSGDTQYVFHILFKLKKAGLVTLGDRKPYIDSKGPCKLKRPTIVRKTLTTEFKMSAVFYRTEKPLKKWAFAFFPDKSATFIAGRLCITKKTSMERESRDHSCLCHIPVSSKYTVSLI